MSRTRRRWSSASRTAPWTCGTQRSEYGSWTLCAERVVAALQPAVAQQVAQLGGDGDLARDAAAPAGRPPRTRRPCRAAPRRSSPPRRSPSGTSRSASASRSAPIALISCVPLRSARPSFGLEHQRLEAGLAQRDRAPGTTCPANSTSPRPMSGSARCASGARSPDAPTLPCSGTTGWMPEREEVEQPVDEQRPAAAVAERERVRPEQQHRPDDLARERRARRPPRGSSAGSPGAGRRRPAAMNVVARSPKPVVTP